MLSRYKPRWSDLARPDYNAVRLQTTGDGKAIFETDQHSPLWDTQVENENVYWRLHAALNRINDV